MAREDRRARQESRDRRAPEGCADPQDRTGRTGLPASAEPKENADPRVHPALTDNLEPQDPEAHLVRIIFKQEIWSNAKYFTAALHHRGVACTVFLGGRWCVQ